MANGESRVNFSLWAVLGSIVLLGFLCISFLYAEGKETKSNQQEVFQRIAIQETITKAILDGIIDLKTGQKDLVAANNKVAEALNAHEKATASALRVQRWNQNQ
jgi:hypothetical protein